jgi:hypothetical protein
VVALILTQVGSAPTAHAQFAVIDASNLAQNVKTAAQTFKQLELHYEQIRFLGGMRKGNYIRALTRDALFGGSGCSVSDSRWAAMANSVNRNLDRAYRLMAVEPDFGGCISDWPRAMQNQYRLANSMSLSSVNGLSALATVKSNVTSGEVQRTWQQAQALATDRTNRSWTANAQKTANAAADTAALLVEVERAQAALLEQALIANQLQRDMLMTELNDEYERKQSMSAATASLVERNW